MEMATVALAGETFAPTVTGGGIVLVDPSTATAIVRYRTSPTAVRSDRNDGGWHHEDRAGVVLKCVARPFRPPPPARR